MKTLCPASLAILLATWLAAPVHAQMGTPLPTPSQQALAVDSLDDVLITVVVGDMQGMLEQLGSLTAQSSPELTGDSLKAMLGAQMGDPQLQGLQPQSGMVFLLFPDGGMGGLVEVSEAMMGQYQEAAAAQGTLTDTAEGLMAVAPSSAALEAVKTVAAEAKSQLLSGPGQPTIDARIDFKQLVDLYGPQVQFMIQGMSEAFGQQMAASPQPGMPDMQSALRILEAEVRGLFDIARQVEEVNFVTSFSTRGIMFEKTVMPVAGSDLARLAAAPTASAEALMRVLPAEGAMRGYVMTNGEALADFLDEVLQAVMEQMTVDEATRQQMAEMMNTMRLIEGQGFDYFIPGGAATSGSFLYQTQGPEAAQQAMTEWIEAFESNVVQNFYGSIGVDADIAVNKDAREHNGVSISQISIEMAGMPGASEGLFPMKYEMAAVDQIIAATIGETSLDSLIDRIRGGAMAAAAPLRAQSMLPRGADAYIDISMGDMLQALGSLTPAGQPNPFEDTAQALQGTPPLVISADMAGGTMKGMMMVPAEVINAIVESARIQPGAAPPPMMAPETEEMPAM